MAIIQVHTPTKIQTIDTDTVTDIELVQLGVTRQAIMGNLSSRNLEAEIDNLKAQAANHETRLVRDIGGHTR